MSSNNSIASRLQAHYYPGPYVDAMDVAFGVQAKVGMRVLDAGCGSSRGCTSRAPLDKMHIVGADIDPSVHENPFCDSAVVCDLSKELPFEDKSFDLIHCRWTLEHIENPVKTFSEFARVLKPSGRLLALTPNMFHYATIISKVTPFWFHRWWRKGGGEEPFPTYYRANSARRLRKICKESGLDVDHLDFIEIYHQYLLRSWPLFLCGVLYERIVNSSSVFRFFRQRLFLQATVRE